MTPSTAKILRKALQAAEHSYLAFQFVLAILAFPSSPFTTKFHEKVKTKIQNSDESFVRRQLKVCKHKVTE